MYLLTCMCSHNTRPEATVSFGGLHLVHEQIRCLEMSGLFDGVVLNWAEPLHV